MVDRIRHNGPWARSLRLIGVGLIATSTTFAFAEDLDPLEGVQPAESVVTYRRDLKPQISTLYADGSQIEVPVWEVWRPICGSDTSDFTVELLENLAAQADAAFADGPAIIVDGPRTRAGVDVIYNLDGSVPSQAVGSFGLSEAWIESQFGDNISFTVNCTFFNFGNPGIIGSTSSSSTSTSFSNSRNGLQNDMDGDDVIQDWLPTTNSCPVRFNGSSTTVSNVFNITWTVANYRATIGSISGSAGNMQYNTQFNFDYDPSNGVSGTSLVDVIIHETGHAMGIISTVDFGANITSWDLYRFDRLDGSGNWNPDTYADFQTEARLNDFNNPSGRHQFDIIDAQHRVEDGSPYQASHLLESGTSLGIMDPAIGSGQTYYPNYYRTADINCFDAIGWDYPPCDPPQLTVEPPATQSVCVNSTVNLTVQSDTVGTIYQWKRNGNDLVDDGINIFGAQTNTLTILSIGPNFGGDFSVDFEADSCPTTSGDYEIVVTSSNFTTQPPSVQTICEGSTAMLTVAIDDTATSYQWRRGTTPLSNGGDISGATSATLTIDNFDGADVGTDYNCVVTDSNGCDNVSSDAELQITFPSAVYLLQPSSQTLDPGQSAMFVVAVQDQAFYTFQWYKDGSPLSDGGNISGSATSALTVSNVSAADEGDYYAVATEIDSGCENPSDMATLTVNSAPDPCPEDLDGSGGIDSTDLAILLGNFGTTSGANPEDGDIDGDGDVDSSDLAMLLGVFGSSCP